MNLCFTATNPVPKPLNPNHIKIDTPFRGIDHLSADPADINGRSAQRQPGHAASAWCRDILVYLKHFHPQRSVLTVKPGTVLPAFLRLPPPPRMPPSANASLKPTLSAMSSQAASQFTTAKKLQASLQQKQQQPASSSLPSVSASQLQPAAE